MKMNRILMAILILLSILPLLNANAQSNLEFTFGLLGGKSTVEQRDLNFLQDTANTQLGGITTKDLSGAWEMGAFLRWKYDLFGFELRPSYFMQGESGTGGGQKYEYSADGMMIAGIFKLYPMENQIMRLFFQGGINWGSSEVEIIEGTYQLQASGHNLGYQLGGGVEFFYLSHSFGLEIGMRWLGIPRNMTSAKSGTKYLGSPISQDEVNQELEINNRDFYSRMSGSQILVFYGLRF